MKNSQTLGALYARRRRLREKLLGIGHILRGSVVVLRRPCTYARCRKCKDGTRHPATYHSLNRGGRTRLTYIARAVEAEAAEWNENWRRLLQVADELTEVNLEILKLKAEQRRRMRVRGKSPRG